MVKLPLRGQDGSVRSHALIDDCDKSLSQFKWCLSGEGYAVRRLPKRQGGKIVYLHRVLLPDAIEVDHKNTDKLDCRKENLRAVTHAQNQQNRKGANKNSRSGVRGVSWNKRDKCWVAKVEVDGKTHRKSFGRKADATRTARRWRSELMPFSENA
jgi:hypothetical protein